MVKNYYNQHKKVMNVSETGKSTGGCAITRDLAYFDLFSHPEKKPEKNSKKEPETKKSSGGYSFDTSRGDVLFQGRRGYTPTTTKTPSTPADYEKIRQQRIRKLAKKEKQNEADEKEAEESGVSVKTLKRLRETQGFHYKGKEEVEAENKKHMIEGLKNTPGDFEENVKQLALQNAFRRAHPNFVPEKPSFKNTMKAMGHNIAEHPVSFGVQVGTVILGVGATLLSGGILGPEVMDALVLEGGSLIGGTELGAAADIEMTAISQAAIDTQAVADTGAAADFLDVSQVSKLPKNQLAVGVEDISSEANVVNDFQAVDVKEFEPEISQYQKAQQIAQQVAEDEEVILDSGKVPTKFAPPEEELLIDTEAVVEEEEVFVTPKEYQKGLVVDTEAAVEEEEVFVTPKEYQAEAPKPVNPEADAVEISGDVKNSSQVIQGVVDDDELVWQAVNLDEETALTAAQEAQLTEEASSIGNNVEKAREFMKKVGNYGRRGVKFIVDNQKKLGAIMTTAGIAQGVISSAVQAKQGKNIKTRINGILGVITGLNDLHENITGTTNPILNDITKGIDNTKSSIEEVNTGIDKLKKQYEDLKTENERIFERTKKAFEVDNRLTQEALIKSNKDNTEQLKTLIRDNRVETEAQKHNALKLDKDVQQLDKDEKKEIDAIRSLKNVIDRPQTPSDFLLALKNFETREGKFDFLAEHYDRLISFDNKSVQSILNIFA